MHYLLWFVRMLVDVDGYWYKLMSMPSTQFTHSIFFLFFPQSLVIAGLGDLSRPANQLSVGQSASLFATGVIWSRYSLVIIPKNYSLFSVNVFVALIQLVQLYRAFSYAREQEALAKTAETVTSKTNWLQNETTNTYCRMPMDAQKIILNIPLLFNCKVIPLHGDLFM